MRTGLGCLLLAASVLLGKLFSSQYPGALGTATVVFGVVWILISAFNMWVGVAKAGYAVGDEFPIFLLIFGLPMLVAVILKWRVL
jgi:hypothetical protein